MSEGKTTDAEWQVVQTDVAWLVQWSDRCRWCGRHKTIASIGRDFPDGREQAERIRDEQNAAMTMPYTQVDVRPTEFGCDHYSQPRAATPGEP